MNKKQATLNMAYMSLAIISSFWGYDLNLYCMQPSIVRRAKRGEIKGDAFHALGPVRFKVSCLFGIHDFENSLKFYNSVRHMNREVWDNE